MSNTSSGNDHCSTPFGAEIQPLNHHRLYRWLLTFSPFWTFALTYLFKKINIARKDKKIPRYARNEMKQKNRFHFGRFHLTLVKNNNNLDVAICQTSTLDLKN